MEATQSNGHPVGHRRQSKFTTANIRQINNLVDRGMKTEQIAEIIGVTPGTLKTMCSKLHISLRRPSFDTGTGPLRRRNRRAKESSSTTANSGGLTPEPAAGGSVVEREPILAPAEQPKFEDGPTADVSIVFQYKGRTQSAHLRLTPEVLGRLALEAEFRGMTLTDLTARTIAAVVKEDRFELVLGSFEAD